jgi:uncharacterized iron-regulated protein
MKRALAFCFLCLSLTAVAASEPDWRAWAESARKQHPLAGSVYDVARARLTSLADRPAPPLPDGLVLLGEVHDNPAHHQVRAWLIAETIKTRPRWRPAVVLEQIDTDKQAAVDRFEKLAPGERTAASLFRALQWQESGWPPAESYQPLIGVVVAARLPILAGDAPRTRVRAIARSGPQEIEPKERTRLGLSPLPAPLDEALRQELATSHCGALPPQAVGGMAVAQRYRDAHLADALLAAARRHGSAILIAGNGHVRSDRGVPWYLRQRAPHTRVTAVLIVEVTEGKTDPAAYLPRDPQGRPTADWVIFTPRAEREDPCKSFLKNQK